MASKPLDLEALTLIAKSATDSVRADSARKGELLPIWLDGRVVIVAPVADRRCPTSSQS